MDRSVHFRPLGLLGCVQALLILAITVITVPLPALARDLRLDTAEIVLVSAAYGIAFSGLLLLGGRIVDRLGCRRVFRAGLGVFGAASTAGALAPGPVPLIAARFVQGAGAALVAPAALALLAAVVPETRARARAPARWGTFAVTGATAGMVAGGAVVSVVSWRWTMIIPAAGAVPAGLPAGPAAARPAPAAGPPPRRRRGRPAAPPLSSP